MASTQEKAQNYLGQLDKEVYWPPLLLALSYLEADQAA
jgi:hypothetical protein